MSEMEITTTEKGAAPRKQVRRTNAFFWTALAILCILLVLSIIVLTARIIDYSAAANREVSLNSNIHKDKLDIFNIQYDNETGDVSVHGMNQNRVVAPGTDVEYTIRIRNTDKIAIDYELVPTVEFLSEYALPIYVRVLDYNDEYIVGSAQEWASVSELNGASHYHTLLSGECVEYTFQWMWPFEQGNDEYDTFLGSTEVEVGIKISFTINAAANLDIGANGGLVRSGWIWNLLILLFALALLVAIILLLISTLKKKKENEEMPDAEADPAEAAETPEESITKGETN